MRRGVKILTGASLAVIAGGSLRCGVARLGAAALAPVKELTDLRDMTQAELDAMTDEWIRHCGG